MTDSIRAPLIRLAETLGARNPTAFVDRLFADAEASIGCKKTIRLDPKRTVTGVIVEATPTTILPAGRSLEGKFRIVMECGFIKERRTYTVEKLP